MTLREAIARARHDVGKYVSMTAKNLGPPPWEARLREAVARDVLRTDGVRPVWEIWADRRGDLAEIVDDAGVVEVDRRIEAIRARASDLEAAGAPGVDESLVADVIAVADGLREVARRLGGR